MTFTPLLFFSLLLYIPPIAFGDLDGNNHVTLTKCTFNELGFVICALFIIGVCPIWEWLIIFFPPKIDFVCMERVLHSQSFSWILSFNDIFGCSLNSICVGCNLFNFPPKSKYGWLLFFFFSFGRIWALLLIITWARKAIQSELLYYFHGSSLQSTWIKRACQKVHCLISLSLCSLHWNYFRELWCSNLLLTEFF